MPRYDDLKAAHSELLWSAAVLKDEGFADALHGFTITAAGQHLLAARPVHKGCSCILTHGQDTLSRNHCVFQHFKSDKPVILGGFRVIQDYAQLG